LIPAELLARLKALCQREGCTLYMALLAAFQTLLHRTSGQDDICVGSPVAGRTRPELEGLIGFFVNTLVLRGDLSGEPTFRELLGRVRETALAAYLHQDLPFEKLVEELSPERSLAHASLFQVMLVLQNAPVESLEIRNLRLRPVSVEETTAKFDLELDLEEHDGELIGWIELATDLFDAPTVERLIAHYGRLLTAALEAPELQALALPLLSTVERQQLLTEWNDTALPLPERLLLPDLFDAQAASTPAAPAATCAGEAFTYAELSARADRLARHLRRLGCGPESRVGVAMERTLDLLVALLGVLKAGAVYVPLDPEYPRERLAFLLEDARPAALLTQESLRDRLPIPAGLPVVLPAALPEIAGRLDPALDGDRLAYVIYTSGSTGRPKGAMVAHRGMLNHLRAKVAALGLDRQSRVAQTASPCFDISVWQLLAPLLTGGSVHIAAEAAVMDPELLLRFASRERITVLEVVPSLLGGMLDFLAAEGGTIDLSCLRWLIVTGEACAPALSRRWLELVPHARLLNAYGPTECSDDVTHYWLAGPDCGPSLALSIGRPVVNTRIYVVDPGQRPVPPGVAGELCVAGRGVGRGYLGLPVRTAEAFVPDSLSGEPGSRLYRTGDLARWLADGTLEFLGRLDHQVKVRGFRIELGEIEAALVALEGVREAAVLVREDVPGDPRLVAYVAGDVIRHPSLRDRLRQRLPEHMVPAAFVTLPALPLTPNGKVDRKALPAPEGRGFEESYLAPRTPVEEVIAGIWAELLRVDRVGAADNFFELGGHSLLATQVRSRLRAAFGAEIPLRTLFEAPALADLAGRVEMARRTGSVPPAPPLLPMDPRLRVEPLPLSFAQQRLWFIDRLEPGTALYNMPGALRAEGALDPAVLAASLGEIARRHEALRTVFPVREGEPVQVVQPAAPFRLPVVDLAGLPRSSREALVLTLAAEEASRPFDLARGPLLRGVLLRLAEEDHVAALTMHHIVSDGWSLGILVRELTAHYAAFAAGRPATLPELPVQYADFAVWQGAWLQGEALESEISFWRRQLAGLPPRLELPTDRPRPAMQSYRGASRPVRLPAELTWQSEALGRREGATLFMVLLAAFQVLLARHSGEADLAVGTPVAGRNRVEIEGLIGFFVNTLVLRGELAGEPSFRELLGRVRDTALAAHEHQDVPFEKLVQELAPPRSLGHSPFFQVMFGLQNAPAGTLEIGDLRLRPVSAATTTAKFDLDLGLEERDGGLDGAVEYATALFDAVTIDRLVRNFERLLAAALATPDASALALPLLSGAECAQMLSEWNDTRAAELPERCLHQAVAEQAARTPAAVAVELGAERWTYRRLVGSARLLARHLREMGVGPETIVGLCAERSPAMVVGMLAILEAGGAYLPLD
ncbi:MAG TPA: amino acid adenylation domain-containing protein, partial [Thermoanaerobaculia bacterium]